MTNQQIREFLTAGRATFTIQSVPTGKHYTYRIQEARGHFFARGLAGDPQDPCSWIYLGRVIGGLLVATSGTGSRETSPLFSALAWYLRRLSDADDLGITTPVADVIFRHEGACGRCGRPLTEPTSIDCGLGPVCRGL